MTPARRLFGWLAVGCPVGLVDGAATAATETPAASRGGVITPTLKVVSAVRHNRFVAVCGTAQMCYHLPQKYKAAP